MATIRKEQNLTAPSGFNNVTQIVTMLKGYYKVHGLVIIITFRSARNGNPD